MFRPAFPNVPTAFVLNDSVVNHFAMRSALAPLVKDGFETTSAISFPMPVSELSSPEVMVSGNPLWTLSMPVVCQPPSRAFRAGFSFGDGNCHRYVITKRCGTLKSAGPRYAKALY